LAAAATGAVGALLSVRWDIARHEYACVINRAAFVASSAMSHLRHVNYLSQHPCNMQHACDARNATQRNATSVNASSATLAMRCLR